MRTKNPGIYITAILPAHNEANDVTAAIESIRKHVDRIIVACDNCSDNTYQVATKAGADCVFATVHNFHRKAGALNQALTHYVNWKLKNQYLLIMDADTVVVNPRQWFNKAASLVVPNRPALAPKYKRLSYSQRLLMRTFHYRKYRHIFDGKAYDCVGSIFQAPRRLDHNTNLEEGQRLEWEAYASKIERMQRVYVLTGTCSLFSAVVMKKVYALHHYQYFYDVHSITEDFAMTVSTKEVGARLISPTDCLCITATKDHFKDLLVQRRRWNLGALQLVNEHKINNVTILYILQQIKLFISVFAYLLFLVMAIYLYGTGHIELTVFWTVIFLGFDITQTAEIWKYGSWFDRIYSFSIIGWLVYSLFLQIAYLWALETMIDRHKVYWNRNQRSKE